MSTYNPNANYSALDARYAKSADVAGGLIPSGGTTGQVLTKNSSGFGWTTLSGSGVAAAVVLSATNDGSSDVTSALQSAITAASNAGLPLIIPKGNYLTTGYLSVPAGLLIRGSGASSRIYGPRASAFIFQLGSNVVLCDLAVENTSTSACIAIDIVANASNIRLVNVKLSGTSAQTLNVNAAGISNILVDGCWFDNVSYGILTNSNANDLKNFRVINSVFTRVYNDAIEFNHPSTSDSTAIGFLVQGNTITVPTGLGSGAGSGFGIGAAGVTDLRIIGNHIPFARREAIHIEDGSRRVTISDNTIDGVSGADAYAGISIYPDCKGITIVGNTISNVAQTGIELVYDGSSVLDSDVTIANNIIDTTSKNGITIGVELGTGDRFIVTGNTIRNCGQHGVAMLGSFRKILLTNNIIESCTQFGVYTDSASGATARLRIYRQNIITACGSGDYSATVTASGNGTVITDRYQQLDATTASSGSTQNLPLFRLGAYASGKIVIQSRRINQYNTRADAIFDVTWNGTALVAKRGISRATNASLEFTNLAMVNGVVNAVTTVTDSGVTLELSAQFTGMCLETNETFSGTVVGTAT